MRLDTCDALYIRTTRQKPGIASRGVADTENDARRANPTPLPGHLNPKRTTKYNQDFAKTFQPFLATAG
jgi:hypothetical protein